MLGLVRSGTFISRNLAGCCLHVLKGGAKYLFPGWEHFIPRVGMFCSQGGNKTGRVMKIKGIRTFPVYFELESRFFCNFAGQKEMETMV